MINFRRSVTNFLHRAGINVALEVSDDDQLIALLDECVKLPVAENQSQSASTSVEQHNPASSILASASIESVIDQKPVIVLKGKFGLNIFSFGCVFAFLIYVNGAFMKMFSIETNKLTDRAKLKDSTIRARIEKLADMLVMSGYLFTDPVKAKAGRQVREKYKMGFKYTCGFEKCRLCKKSTIGRMIEQYMKNHLGVKLKCPECATTGLASSLKIHMARCHPTKVIDEAAIVAGILSVP